MAGSGLQPALIGLLYTFPALSGIVLVVRVWRKRVDRTLGGDDALIVIAWALSLVNSILTHLYALETYGGYYAQDVPVQLINWKKADVLQYVLSIEYNPVICIIKASFLWSLQRLRSRNIWIVRSLWAMQAINFAYMIGAVIATILPCTPLSKRFNPALPGTCYDPVTFVIANVSVAIVTDALVLLIPTWIIYDLQMSLRKKLITISFLSMGLIVIVIGILRLVWLVNIFKGVINNHSVEQAYSAIESNIAIIGASGPTVKYIFSFIIPGLKAQSQGNKNTNYATSSSQHDPSRSRRNRSEYGDLDSDSIENERIEMKGDWQWKQKDSDAHSDEQRITDINDGIVKTVDWTVSTRQDSISNGRVPIVIDDKSDTRRAVQPSQVV